MCASGLCSESIFVHLLCKCVDSSTQFVRFFDDTAMLALLSEFASYQSYLSSVVLFSSWCSNNLHLNVSKTKEMCIDFRRNRTVISPIVINGEPVEQVDSFKYLGVILDEKLSFTEHVTALKKRSISSDCTFFESYELSTLIHYFFYAFTVA